MEGEKSRMRTLFSDDPFEEEKKSIFLAGPTRRNAPFSRSWRKDACDYLQYYLKFDGAVYVPEYGKDDTPFDLMAQVEWEKQGLNTASVLLFYLCRKLDDGMFGFTTNVEFGRYLTKYPNKIVLCSPEWAEKNRYLEWQYKDEVPDGIVYKSIGEALTEAARRAERPRRT